MSGHVGVCSFMGGSTMMTEEEEEINGASRRMPITF